MTVFARVLALACFLLLAIAAPAFADGTATDPTGDNCTGGPCGMDLTTLTTTVASNGDVTFTIAHSDLDCSTVSWPATRTQPAITLLPASATEKTETNVASVSAASSFTDYKFHPIGGTGSDTDVDVAETVTGTSVTVTVPANLIATVGALPLKWYATNSCKEFPGDPISAYKDLAPDSGLYTLEAPVVEQPKDECPNVAGDQATVPAGYQKDPGGNCLQLTYSGSAAANVLTGNALANVLNGLGGNDTLRGGGGNDTARGGVGNDKVFGDAGNDKLFGDAGNDQAHGGVGNDSVTGGAGMDKLWGDAGADKLDGADHKRGDMLNGGAGRDTCTYNAGDVLVSCERTVLKR